MRLRALVWLSVLAAAACSNSDHAGANPKDASANKDGGLASSGGARASGGAAGSGGKSGMGGAGGAAGQANTGAVAGKLDAGGSTSMVDAGVDSSVDAASSDAGSGDNPGDSGSSGAGGATSTGGAAGKGGAGGQAAGGTGGASLDTESVLERNKRPSRDGAYVEPKLTLAAASALVKEAAFTAGFPGALYGSPLYLQNGPGGKGTFFVAASSNDVSALDEKTGAIVWQKNLGPAPTANGVPCGNIHPLGVISTPAIDPVSGTIYVAGAIGTSSIERHEIHALSVIDGKERAGFPIVVAGTSGGTTFTPAAQNQRSALSIVNGILYVAYGGHSGDCGPYHGWVFAVDINTPTRIGAWATLGQGEGIWAAGGMASDGNGVFAITGNNTVGATDHMVSDGEEVVRLTGLAVLERSNKNIYFPAIWRGMDATDADYGASSPVYVTMPGSNPSHVLATVSKGGHVYLLNPDNLGGMGAELADVPVSTVANAVHAVPSAYTTAKGAHLLLVTDSPAGCPVATTSRSVMSILLPPGSPLKPQVAWCAPMVGPATGQMITTTDGKANAVVWFMTGNFLKGYDGDTGALIYGGGKTACLGYRQWTSAIAVNGRIIVGGDGHLCAWSPP
jgi:hypothetical protein